MEPLERTAETVAVDGSFNIHETAIPEPSRYILSLKIEPAAQNVNRHSAQPALNFFDAWFIDPNGSLRFQAKDHALRACGQLPEWQAGSAE